MNRIDRLVQESKFGTEEERSAFKAGINMVDDVVCEGCGDAYPCDEPPPEGWVHDVEDGVHLCKACFGTLEEVGDTIRCIGVDLAASGADETPMVVVGQVGRRADHDRGQQRAARADDGRRA